MTSMSTGAIWDAVGSQSLRQALPTLEREGWAKVAAVDGLSYVVLIREAKTVHVYARSSALGMIHVGTLG